MASAKYAVLSVHFPDRRGLRRIKQAAKLSGVSASLLAYQAALDRAEAIIAEDAKKAGKCPACGQAAA